MSDLTSVHEIAPRNNATVAETVWVTRQLPGQTEWSVVDPFTATVEGHWTRGTATAWCKQAQADGVPTCLEVYEGDLLRETTWFDPKG